MAARVYAWNDVEVMRAMADNPRTPLQLQLGLMRHRNDDVAFAAFGTSRTALKRGRASVP